MKELMIHVERIVRPIRADWSKLRIRRELLAHLQAAFDEERSRGLEDAAALAEAKRRLGEPEALSRELQASVSRLEQLAVTPFPCFAATAFIVACIVIPLILSVVSGSAIISSGVGGELAPGEAFEIAQQQRTMSFWSAAKDLIEGESFDYQILRCAPG